VVADDEGATGADTKTVTVTNVAPTAAIVGAPASAPEGTPISLASSVSDAGAGDTRTYDWRVTKNGTLYAAGTAAITFTPDDNGPYVVTLAVTDDDGGVGIDSKTLTVTNVAPTASIAGPATGRQGVDVVVQSTAPTDPSSVDTAAGFGYLWRLLKDGAAIDLTGVHTTGATFSWVPATAGTYTVVLEVTDKDGGRATTTKQVVVTSVPGITLLPNGRLVVVGTDGDDKILVNPGGGAPEIKVKLNDDQQTFVGVREIVIYANAGNDDVQIAGGVTVPVTAFGGAGNDRLKGGGGVNVLVGGDGDDVLLGGGVRDILIGGAGADRLVGSSTDDILIAGYTLFDTNLAALLAIRQEWTSDRGFAERVANLAGTGTTGANGTVYLVTSGPAARVFDDDAEDILTGAGGTDWFLFNSRGGVRLDRVLDMTACEAEFAEDLVLSGVYVGP
jgi:Ca2+-binding RTX toxin-like protein